MLLSKYLTPFSYYNIILIILFSLSISSIESFSIINSISYIFFHFLIIYLGLYYPRMILYSIYFLYGLGFDILLINQIGPHLFVFMTLLFFFYFTKKYFFHLSNQKIYLLILFIQLLVILLEMLLAGFFFDYDFNFDKYLKFFFLSIISSYPVFFIFSKIDNLQ